MSCQTATNAVSPVPLMYFFSKPIAQYRGADKSLARPGRKQANVSVRMAWISFGALPWRERNLMLARFSILLKSRASLTCFRACFLPGRAKDLSAPRYRMFLYLIPKHGRFIAQENPNRRWDQLLCSATENDERKFT